MDRVVVVGRKAVVEGQGEGVVEGAAGQGTVERTEDGLADPSIKEAGLAGPDGDANGADKRECVPAEQKREKKSRAFLWKAWKALGRG